MYMRINALNRPAADEVYLDYCPAQAQYDSELTQKSQEVQRLQSAGAAGFGKYQLMEQQMVRQAWSSAKRTGHAAADFFFFASCSFVSYNIADRAPGPAGHADPTVGGECRLHCRY